MGISGGRNLFAIDYRIAGVYMSKNQKYLRDKELSDSVTRTKVSHGRIEAAVRVREAKTKGELDLELKRLQILKRIDESTIGQSFHLPSGLRCWQQLILIVGSLNLKASNEVVIASKKLGYSGQLDVKSIRRILVHKKKEYFRFDRIKGWLLTDRGQNEFSRLKQFI